MYLDQRRVKDYWAIDIEGDDLPSNVIWCMCAVNILTNEEVSLSGYAEIRKWIDARKTERAVFIGHNIIGYDAPTCNRLLAAGLTIGMLVDTLVLSMVYSPSLDGGHSLAAWGERLRCPKGEFNDFSHLSEEMLTYCMQDARLCAKVYRHLVVRMSKVGFTDVGLDLEHRSWQLIKQQQKNGFAFNIKEANLLYSKLREKENEIKDKIYEYWPAELRRLRTFRKPFKADGHPSANYLRHCDEYDNVRLRRDEGEYDVYGLVNFSIGSPSQRVEKLLLLGWEPREFTKPSKTHPKGQPQPTNKGKLSPSLEKFVEESGKEEVKLIAQWIEINSRASMVNTWIEAYNDTSGCIHGSLWYANTLRYRHSNPNTANIPAVRLDKDDKPLREEAGVFTYEARDLWVARDVDRCLVGSDAKGIQLRVLAHYLNNPEFTEAVLNGNPHSYNQQIGGFGSKAIAKTFIYAFLLGAGDEKIGQIIGGSTKDGRNIKGRFVSGFPGLSDLLNSLARQVERTGRIILCDGTPIIVSAPHTRLGYLLQGDESRIMKKAAIFADQQVRRRKLDVLKVGDIHDEWQNDVHRESIEEFTGLVCPTSFARSGEFFNYRIPIHCDSKVGLTWAETH